MTATELKAAIREAKGRMGYTKLVRKLRDEGLSASMANQLAAGAYPAMPKVDRIGRILRAIGYK